MLPKTEDWIDLAKLKPWYQVVTPWEREAFSRALRLA